MLRRLLDHPIPLRISWFRHELKLRWLRARLKIQGRKLVVINLTEHMGDIIACEPVARQVRSLHPRDYIIWSTKAVYAPLVANHPCVDEVMAVFCLYEWIRLRRRNLFDQVYELHPSGRMCGVCHEPLENKAYAPEITLDNYYNHGSLLQVFSRCAGLPALADAPKVYLPPCVKKRIDGLNLPRKFIALHCTSNETTRDWTKDGWVKLVARMRQEFNCPLVELGLKPVLAEFGAINLCGKLEMLETAEVISRSNLFIGVDSGLAHFANAADIPGVVLLGHYRDFKNYCPFTGGYSDGSNAHLVHFDGPLREMPFEDAWTAVHERWLLAYGAKVSA